MLKKFLILTLILVSLLAGGFFYLSVQKISKMLSLESFEVSGNKEAGGTALRGEAKDNLSKSLISGIPCQNYNRRPFAVILAEDSEARPLSAISMADLVFEMEVITGSVTRMMAIYQCESPQEIGSIRSARHDFIPLALGLDAIFAHWGGSHFALDILKQEAAEDLDALPNPHNIFYRKLGIPAPHNGFTNMERMINAAQKLGYRLTMNFEGYQHLENPKSKISNSKQIMEVNYAYPYNVKYEYNPKTDSYLRWRAGLKEVDKLTGKQVEIQNMVIMRAKSRQIEGQYNDIDIEGTGEAVYYVSGKEVRGYWQKDKANPSSKLYFYDENDEEVKFAPGKIWVNVVRPDQKVNWKISD